MEIKIATCQNCHKKVELINSIGFQDICESCYEYLHCCLQCKIFDINAMKCTSLSADKISSEKDKNYCEEFQASYRSFSNKKQSSSLSKLNGLFKDKTEEDNSSSLDKLNKLFKKD